MPDPAPSSVHADCLDALVTVIDALDLVGITAIGTQEVVSDIGKVGTTLITDDNGNLAGSFVSVSPWQQEDVTDFTNVRDLITYRCLVAIMANRDEPTLSRKLEWRQKIRSRLLNLKIGVPSVRKCSLQMLPVVDGKLWMQKQIYFSAFVVLCESIESRATI